MPQLWYTYDEVNSFHPIVESALNSALRNTGLDAIAEVIHHPAIPNSTIIPDFAIRLRATQRYVFIIEVKRTQRDVDSQRYQNQSRSYVTEFGPYWEPNYHKYFCVTNVERLLLMADRQGPLVTCLLKNNPKQHSLFDAVTYDATASIAEFQTTLETILPIIFNRTPPEWDNNWEQIIESFHANYIALRSSLGFPDAISKELSLYELFRLLAYSYLKDYYTQTGSPNASHFRNYPSDTATLAQFTTGLSNNYDRIIQLDFKQIFENHPNQGQRIFPDNFTNPYLQYFRNLIQCFNQYSNSAVADNSSPSYVFNLLTSKIYEREELHRKGKIMSDSELSNILAVLCIDQHEAKILDPGCGDGALLDAAYDRIRLIASSLNHVKAHNTILEQIDGIEVDPFLSQLAAFRLLSKNLSQINNRTTANITIGDIFHTGRPNQYDAILMNPPFLRNDDPNSPITAADKLRMNGAILAQGLNCFVTDAKQPNLYFYFTNYVWHYLRSNGKAGLILMAKFLNNEDGTHLKQFILDKVEAIVSYPRKYFQDFVVTTVIVILKNGNNTSTVSFLRVSDENLILNPELIKPILALTNDSSTPAYRLKVVPRNTLNPSDNWRQYLQDKKYDDFSNLACVTNISHHFAEISRGGAEAAGGSTLIFPEYDSQSNQYFGAGPKLTPQQKATGQQRSRINIPITLNARISFGIQNNFTRRNYNLTIQDLELEKALHFPSKADGKSANALPVGLQADMDLNNFYNEGVNSFTLKKWKQIVNNAFNNTFTPGILIPRADRTKHVVYYNSHITPITLSTNFLFCDSLINENAEVGVEDQKKFITAFLLSSFGQIQFELEANNQEGLRKLEVFQLKRFNIPLLTAFSSNDFTSVLSAFDALNTANLEFSGDEGINNNPRRSLDQAIAEVIFAKANLGFASATEMVDYFELFLADLVEERRI